ncbi:hypothetical protein ABPG75_004269 [Micractinium tetrahymenae]
MRGLLLLAALAAVLASCQAIDPRVCTMPHPPNDPDWARIFNITDGRIDDKYAESVIMRSLAKITGQFKKKNVIGNACRIASWEAVEVRGRGRDNAGGMLLLVSLASTSALGEVMRPQGMPHKCQCPLAREEASQACRRDRGRGARQQPCFSPP